MNGAAHEPPMLAGMSRSEMELWTTEHGQPAFRSRQLADWVFRRLELNPDRMTNLPRSMRSLMHDGILSPAGGVDAVQTADDGTEKMLVRLADSQSVEMVLIPQSRRMTLCLSTQVGCPVRCRFCASGRAGLVRNLRSGEIIEQLLFGARRFGRVPDNVVFMGIGEGLLNVKELLRAVSLMVDAEGFGMSPRRLTVSTSGIVPGIRQLAAFGRELTLAVSLHAVDDETRAQLIPDGFRYPIREILKAADEYRDSSGRMVTLEYVLLDTVNDSVLDAKELAWLARTHHCKINLIAYNDADNGFRRPPQRTVEKFLRTVENCGARATLRREHGASSTAACGQLRHRLSREEIRSNGA